MEKIRNKGCFHTSVAYCKADVPVAGRSKANEQTLRTGMNEWKSVETRRNEKKTSETRMNESCERENICITNPSSVDMQEVKVREKRSRCLHYKNLSETQETTSKSNSNRKFAHIESQHPRAVVTCAIINKASPIFG